MLWCVEVCGVCVVCVCVWCGVAWLGTRAKNPCAGSKRLRVWVQNASVCTGKATACVTTCGRFCRYTRKRFEPTHGDEGEGGGRGSLLSFFFLSSVVLFPLPLPSPPLSLSLSFSFSFCALFSLSARHSFFLGSFLFFIFFCLQSALCVSFLNDNDNDRSSNGLSLYTRL